MASDRLGGRRLVGALVVLVIAIAVGIEIEQNGSPVHETRGHEHCFAEWCFAPQSAAIDAEGMTVGVRVRSAARQASQRPDHPQAWVLDATGRRIGGPQPELDTLVAPGESYMANLRFTTSRPGPCPTLLVTEGGWPSFLGLGYAPSPFTSQVEWRLCELAT